MGENSSRWPGRNVWMPGLAGTLPPSVRRQAGRVAEYCGEVLAGLESAAECDIRDAPGRVFGQHVLGDFDPTMDQVFCRG